MKWNKLHAWKNYDIWRGKKENHGNRNFTDLKSWELIDLEISLKDMKKHSTYFIKFLLVTPYNFDVRNHGISSLILKVIYMYLSACRCYAITLIYITDIHSSFIKSEKAIYLRMATLLSVLNQSWLIACYVRNFKPLLEKENTIAVNILLLFGNTSVCSAIFLRISVLNCASLGYMYRLLIIH